MRSLVICALALSFGACDRPATSSSTRALDGLDVVELERTAAEPWLRHDDESPKIEAALAKALVAGYATDPATPDGYATVVRTALVEWTARVRYRLGDGLHTAVPAFADDPDCQGSLIGDHALVGYVDAITRGKPRERDAIASLDALSRQLACLGELQNVRLADAMTLAYAEVEDGLIRNQLREVVPSLVQAVAQPMLLVHDIERHRGPDAPLAIWFAEHERLLREGAKNRRSPSSWHGLWLYDRITGRLRGFRVDDRAVDDNTVDLEALFAFLAHSSLGATRCSLAEVIQRGTHDGTYACLAEACERGEVDPSQCKNPVDGDGAGGGGDPGAEGVSIPGMTSGGLLTCITTQVVAPTEKVRRCMSEATGLGARPPGLLSKEITGVAMSGSKFGGRCDLMDQAADDYNRRVAKAQADYEAALASARQTLTTAIEALKDAQQARDEAFAIDPKSPEAAERQAELDQAEERVHDASARLWRASFDAAAKREADRKAAAAALQQAQQQGSGTGSGDSGGSDGGGSDGGGSDGGGSDGGDGSGGDADCVEGAASCGNGCSAIAAEVQAMADCVLEPTTPETKDPLGGCGPACDPLDPADSKSGVACVDTLEKNPLSTVSAACWNVWCSPGAETAGAAGCCGADGRTTFGEPQLPDPCASANCTGGRPAGASGGGCTCGGTGGGMIGGAELLGFPPP